MLSTPQKKPKIKDSFCEQKKKKKKKPENEQNPNLRESLMNESYDSNVQSEYDYMFSTPQKMPKINHSFCEETDSISPIRHVRRNSTKTSTASFVCLFMLRFYGPVNPMGSCRARSVYLTTHVLDRLSPLCG